MKRLLAVLASLSFATGCAVSADRGDDAEDDNVEYEQPFVSDVATLMDFDFDGELTSSSGSNLTGQIKTQLFYTVGHFNAEPGVARLDKVKLTNVTSTYSGGLYRVRYHAKLPVAWGHKTDLPSTYTITLPKRVDQSGLNAFTTKYSAECNDGDHGANVSNFWYHYRPANCSPAPADVTVSTARAVVSTQNTVAKYPEYHKVWEDGALNVVAIFGKYEIGGADSDAGVIAYRQFLSAVRDAFPTATSTGNGNDITFRANLAGGRRLQVAAILVDELRSAPASFDTRYSELSAGADMILYNGHAGLGANVRSLQSKGKWMPGKYQIFFINGCDTFAYADDTLAKTRAALNPDDPTGTKYMDIMTNAMPAYFNDLSDSSMALINALSNPSAPKSYGAIFRDIASVQVVVGTGEEDNVFNSSKTIKAAVFGADGAVGKGETVPYEVTLPAGRYTFTMTPDGSAPGGDADLYVRVGAAPTAVSTYKCQSYIYNSNERCTVNLATPSKVYMLARGDKLGVSSKYRVDAFAY
jgi:hypothetical protein